LGSILTYIAGPIDALKTASAAGDAAAIIKGAEVARSGVIALADMTEVSAAASEVLTRPS
jgi:hypothetical protein